MAKINIDVAVAIMEAAGLTPIEPFKGGDYPWKCICKVCKREVSPRFRSVRDRNSGCRYCAGNASVEEEVLEEMKSYDLIPLSPYPGALKKWKSQCMNCGNEVSPRIADIRMGHLGCIYCGRVKQGLASRLTSNTGNLQRVYEIMSAANLEPLEDFQLSNSKWKCRCKICNEIVYPSYSQIQGGSGGCKTCARARAIGRNRLDQAVAERIMRNSNWEPLIEYPGAMKPWKCKCMDCGEIGAPRYAHIQQGRKGCKKCGISKTSESLRLPQSRAFEIADSAGFLPLDAYKGRHFRWKLQCKTCGKEVTPQLGGILAGNGCKFCAGKIIDHDEAQIVMIAAGLKPLVSYPGAGVPWLCTCLKCSKEVSPRYSQIKMGIGGCRYCATHGYDFSKPGILYLLTHLDLGAHKIGITNINAKEKRLEKHYKEGWILYESKLYEDGNLAFEVEQKVIDWLRGDLGLPIYLSKKQMPQGGFTETVEANEIDLITIWNYARKVQPLVGLIEKRRIPKTTMPSKKKQQKSQS